MPIYEYACEACGHVTEVIQHRDDPPPAACPECGGTVKKLFSAPAFQFKGEGWYVTDYARKGGGKGDSAKGDTTKSDSAKSDSAKGDTAKADSAKGDAAKGGAAKGESSSATSESSSGSAKSDPSAGGGSTPSNPASKD